MLGRLISILLCLLMPLQVTWAAIDPHCQHDIGLAAQSLGHHEHHHNASDHIQIGENNQDLTMSDLALDQENVSADLKTKSATAADNLDSDCGTCHSCWSTAILGTHVKPNVVAMPTQSNPCDVSASRAEKDRPERPNWILLA